MIENISKIDHYNTTYKAFCKGAPFRLVWSFLWCRENNMD